MDVPEVPPSDLEAFVLDKLTGTVGADAAETTLADAKQAAGVAQIASPDDVVAVGRVMAGQGAFVGIVGDLLVLTAARWRSP